MKHLLRDFIFALLILSGLFSFEVATAQGPCAPCPSNPPDIPDGYMIIEGDIQVPVDFYTRRLSPSATWDTKFWPNGIVPFEFDANVSAVRQSFMLIAMGDWEAAANVTFQRCSPCSGDYVHIQNSIANNSAVGKQGGKQISNIFNWDSEFVMAHELAHTLGYWHEQSRPNRDSFVQINLANVCKATDATCYGGFCYNSANVQIDCDFAFAIHLEAGQYGPYDFDSVMHYPRWAFSRNGSDTITVLFPNYITWQNVIGQTTHLSTWDKTVMRLLYPPPNWRFLDINAAPGGSGLTLFSPYNSVYNATAFVPAGGTIVIQPGIYTGAATYTKPQTWYAPIGGVTIH